MLTVQGQLVMLLAVAGTVLSTLGYRIRYQRAWHLIGGIDCRLLRDPDGFGRWVGSVGLMLGSISFGAAALAYSRPDLNAILGTSYAGAVLAGTAVLAIGSLRYLF
jgi:hypothetical protein